MAGENAGAQHFQGHALGHRRALQKPERLGFAEGAYVAMRTIAPDGDARVVGGFRLVDYDVPRGCAAAYFPETNPLMPLARRALRSNTPTSKSIPVALEAWSGEWVDRLQPELAVAPQLLAAE